MKNTINVTCCLVVLLAISGAVGQTPNKTSSRDSVPQENSASLEETFDWLKAHLSDVRAEFWTADNKLMIVSYRTIRLSGCNLTWRRESYTIGDLATHEFTASLSDLDPSNVTVEKAKEMWRLSLNTYNKKLAIKAHKVEESGQMGDEVALYDFQFYMGDEKLAHRVATAFSHAIKLCGGKKEPF